MFDGKYNIKIFGAIVFVLFYATSLVHLAYNSISHAKKNYGKIYFIKECFGLL